MFDTAIVCTDLMYDSDELVSCAGGLAALGVREAVLTHVLDVFDDPEGGFAQTDEAADVYQRQLLSLEQSGLSVHVEAPLGHPVFSLEEVRRRHAASLIVIGCHGKGGFDHSFSRSVSASLLQMTDTPILLTSLVPTRLGLSAGGISRAILRNVLYCTDPPSVESNVFSHMLDLVRYGASDVTLLHVQDRRFCLDGFGRSLPERDRRDAVGMVRMRDALVDAGAEHVVTELIGGMPAEELSKRAASGEYTLIVLGNRGRYSTREDYAFGSVSDCVLRESITPVLLVPNGESVGTA